MRMNLLIGEKREDLFHQSAAKLTTDLCDATIALACLIDRKTSSVSARAHARETERNRQTDINRYVYIFMCVRARHGFYQTVSIYVVVCRGLPSNSSLSIRRTATNRERKIMMIGMQMRMHAVDEHI